MENALSFLKRKREMNRRGFIFTNKKQTNIGIMSTIIGAMCILSNLYGYIKSYKYAGAVPQNVGAALFLTAVLSCIGLILGAVSRTEKNKFYLFSYLGIIFNTAALIMTGGILYAGAYL